MEDARIRAFSRLFGSKTRTLTLPLAASVALFAASDAAYATPECRNLGSDVLTAGDDTCQITSASPLTNNVDALAQTVADTLKLDGAAAGAFSFDAAKIGTEFTNFEAVQVLGPITLSGATAAAAANWTVTSGTLTIANSNALNLATSVTVAAAGTMTGTTYSTGPLTNHGFVAGNVTMNGAVVSDGTLSPGVGAGNIGTMTINGTFSSGANFGHATMDVDLSVASNPGVTSDFFHVTGTATGGTLIGINQTNVAPGIASTGNGFLLWQIDGTTSGNQFALAAPVVSGPYQYLLSYTKDFAGTSDGIFLKTVLREEFYGTAALLAGEQAAIRSCFRSDQRMPDATRSRDSVRSWVNLENAHFKTDPSTGVQINEKMNCATGGLDLGVGDGIRLGVVGGYANETTGVTTPGGLGSLDGNTTAVEALLSVGTPQYFFNVTAGYASTNWTFDGPVQAPKNATQSGMIGSAQAGSTINVTPFRFKFIAAVNYDNTTCSSDCLLAGTTLDTGMLEAKGTIRIEAMTHDINPYVAVSFSDDLSRGSTITNSGQSISIDTAHSLLSLNAGFNAPIDDGLLLFGDFSVLDGMSNNTSGYTAAGGLKAFW